MNKIKICSSGSLEGLLKMINKYFYSSTYRIENGVLYNSKGIYTGGEITEKKGRFIFYQFNKD